MSDSPPPGVAARLAALRALSVVEEVAAARDRLARERPASTEDFDAAVAGRLRELRALCELAAYLHRAVGVTVPRP
jgi:hypothetical protein